MPGSKARAMSRATAGFLALRRPGAYRPGPGGSPEPAMPAVSTEPIALFSLKLDTLARRVRWPLLPRLATVAAEEGGRRVASGSDEPTYLKEQTDLFDHLCSVKLSFARWRSRKRTKVFTLCDG